VSTSADGDAGRPGFGRMSLAELLLIVAAEVARFLLAVAITLVNAYVLYSVLRTTIPEASKDLIIGVVSAAGTAQGIVLQYYFGSSAGSAAKDRKG
jgi:hypothetical protein